MGVKKTGLWLKINEYLSFSLSLSLSLSLLFSTLSLYVSIQGQPHNGHEGSSENKSCKVKRQAMPRLCMIKAFLEHMFSHLLDREILEVNLSMKLNI